MSGKKRYKVKICQIIPTKDRPLEMRRLLESMRKQSCKLDQIVVVDGSRAPIEDLLADFPDLNITYVRKYPPSLIPQRNAGLEAVDPEIKLMGFLDDDIVMEPGSVEAMYEFWQNAGAEVGGAEYNLIYDRNRDNFSRTFKWLEKIFFISDEKKKGQILPSGFAASPHPAESTMRVNWLSGGCNVYRRHIFEKFKFDDWYLGWGIGDDLEFSFRVSKEYELLIVSGARLKHLPLPMKQGRGYLCGMIITINHFHFAQINSDFSLALCAWANLGRALAQLYKGISSLNFNNLQRSAGHMAGIYKGLTGNLQPVSRIVK